MSKKYLSVTLSRHNEKGRVKFCRICLTMDTSLYTMKESTHLEFFEQFIGTMGSKEDGLPQMLCWECAHRLLVSSKLKRKALTSQGILAELVASGGLITSNSIKLIDRISKGLETTLTCKKYINDHCDLQIIYANTDIDDLYIPNTENTDQYSAENTQNSIEKDPIQYEYIKEEKHEIEDIVISKKKREFKPVNASIDIEEADIDDFDDVESWVDSDEEVISSVEESDEESDDESLIDSDTIEEIIARHKELNAKPRVRRNIKRLVINTDMFDTITFSTEEEQLEEHSKKALSDNYVGSHYKCIECFIGFRSKETFEFHLLRHTEKSGAHKCSICKMRFVSAGKLRDHQRLHATKYVCKLCPSFTAASPFNANRHEQYHNGRTFVCKHCPKQFTKHTTYLCHLRTSHPSGFVCQLCGFPFISESGLRMHKQRKHRFDDLEVPLEAGPCERCGLRFASTEALEAHQRSSKHNWRPPPKPHIGRRRQRNEPKQKIEPTLRPKIKTIQCELCEATLGGYRAYHFHFRRAHPGRNRTKYPRHYEQAMCDVCGKVYNCKSILEDHMRTHSGEKRFKCDQCGKTFVQKTNLAIHMRVHYDSRPTFGCSVCGKQLSSACNLKRHMQGHEGVRFPCKACSKSFTQQAGLRLHVAHVHLRKPWPKRERKASRKRSEQADDSED